MGRLLDTVQDGVTVWESTDRDFVEVHALVTLPSGRRYLARAWAWPMDRAGEAIDAVMDMVARRTKEDVIAFEKT